MKKLLSFLICTALILSIIPTAVFAAGETSGKCGDNLTWNYNTETKTLTISGTGDMYGYGSNNTIPWYQYHYDVKYVTIGDKVTSIGDRAFLDCRGLTSVTIPDSVTSIGDGVFCYCEGLTSIIIGKNVATIGGSVFGGCINLNSLTVDTKNEKYYSGGNCIIENDTNKLILGCENSTIPWGITGIGDCAFSGCAGLTSIAIPNSVTGIGNEAFCYCTSLTSITISYGVTSIGYNAFSDCRGLTSIAISNSVTSIDYGAFSGCTALKIIYYTGSKEEWNKINLEYSRIPSNAEIIYNATDCDINGHSLGEWIAEVPATCTKDGVKEHYECSVCHKYFDKDKNEITDLVIPAHHDPSLIKTIAPTCTTYGYDVVKCLNCGLRYTVNYVAATGHSFGDWTVTKKLTCTDDGVEIRCCGKCGETETRTTKAQGHKQGELVKHQNATCTKDGSDYYKCLTCGETYFVLGFAKNGHWFLDGECIDCGIAESDVPFDIDLDCAVSATDLTYLKRILLLDKTAECDPNGDGKLNILDLIILKKRLAKK